MAAVEEQVDRGVAVIGAGLLQVLDAPDKRSVDLDGESDALVRLEPFVDRVVGTPGSPPGGDARLGEDVAKGARGPQLDAAAATRRSPCSSTTTRSGFLLERTLRRVSLEGLSIR